MLMQIKASLGKWANSELTALGGYPYNSDVLQRG